MMLTDSRPSSATPVDEVMMTETTSNELAALLGLEHVCAVRATGEGKDRRFSLIDVAALVSGKNADMASLDIRLLLKDIMEVRSEKTDIPELLSVRSEKTDCPELLSVDYFQFPGERQRKTPVGNIRTALYVAIMQRSRNARKLAFKAIDVLVRYLGGDPELAQEILTMRKIQEHLAEEQPSHPLRAFGEDVESFITPSRAPPQIFNVPGIDAGDHAYLFHSGVPGIMKIGRAADVGLRREQIQKDVREIHKEVEGGDPVVSIAVLWKYCGGVEKHIHRFMAPHKTNNMGKHTEYYLCDVSAVLKIFPDALAGYHEENAVNFGSCEYERAAKRRRVEAELEEDELRHAAKLKKESREAEAKRAEEHKAAESKRVEADARREEELKEQQHKQTLELSQLEFQAKKNKLSAPPQSKPQQSPPVPPPPPPVNPPVTLEMVTDFASKYLVFTCRTSASTCGAIHRVLAKQNGLTEKVPNSFVNAGRAAFQKAGFYINQNIYWKDKKPYRLIDA